MEIQKGVPFRKAPRTGTLTETIKAMEIGDCIFIEKDRSKSARAIAQRYGIRLISARQEDGTVGMWRREKKNKS